MSDDDDEYVGVGELLYNKDKEVYVASAWFTADNEANPLDEGHLRQDGVGDTIEAAMDDLAEGIEEYEINV